MDVLQLGKAGRVPDSEDDEGIETVGFWFCQSRDRGTEQHPVSTLLASRWQQSIDTTHLMIFSRAAMLTS
jgi:hypothetical protein